MFKGLFSFSDAVDRTLAFILTVDILLLVFITALMLYFIFAYSRKKNRNPAQIEGNVWLEIVWLIIPTILVMVMFYFGAQGYLLGRRIPENALKIDVTGRQWSWLFEYPNGRISDTMVVPVKKAIRLDLHSRDVIHNFYAPDFRLKMDAVPGRTNSIWFKSNYPGKFDVFCAEYCGTAHSGMRTRINAVSDEEFNAWLMKKEERPRGEVLYKQVCKACHSLDGSVVIGPSFRGLFNQRITVISDGTEREIIADEQYIRRSIEQPSLELRKGFQDLMKIDTLPKADIDSLVIFIMEQ